MLLFDSPIDGVVQAMRKRGRIHGSVLLMVYDRGALAFWGSMQDRQPGTRSCSDNERIAVEQAGRSS